MDRNILSDKLAKYGAWERQFQADLSLDGDIDTSFAMTDNLKREIMDYVEQDLLTRLFESTKALHERFGDDWTLKDAVNKFNEESDEFKRELRIEVEKNMPMAFKAFVFNEMIDVLVTMMSCCIKLELDPAGLIPAIEAVITKNDAKTLETHERVNGMIVRKK